MSSNRVYAAGPIGGFTHDECTEWRDYLIKNIDHRIEVFCPMRGCEFLKGPEKLTCQSYELNPMTTQKGIMDRDFNDVKRADVLFANLLRHGGDAQMRSLGTAMEIAWAYALQKPVVLLMDRPNIHEHAMLEEAASYIVDDLDVAIRLTEALLLPDVKR